MKKSEFLDKLCQGLRFHTDPEEIQRMVAFYDQSIDDRMEDGMTEEEAVDAMGDLDYIISEARNAWEQESSGGPSNASGSQSGAEKTFPLSAVDRLEIYDTSGNVKVRPSPDGDIHVEYTATQDWRYDISAGPVLTVRRARNRDVDDRMDFDVFGYKFSIPRLDLGGLFSNELRLTVLLPEGKDLPVYINAASGDVDISDVGLLTLNVRSASGDAKLRNVHGTGKLVIITASGEAGLCKVSAPELTVSTVSGDVDVRGVNCADIGVKTVSGDIDLEDLNATRRVSIYSVSGDVRVEPSIPCADLSAETVSGDIDLRLAGAAGLYTVTTRTRSGDIRVRGELGSGPNQARLQTLSGDIDLDFQR